MKRPVLPFLLLLFLLCNSCGTSGNAPVVTPVVTPVISDNADDADAHVSAGIPDSVYNSEINTYVDTEINSEKVTLCNLCELHEMPYPKNIYDFSDFYYFNDNLYFISRQYFFDDTNGLLCLYRYNAENKVYETFPIDVLNTDLGQIHVSDMKMNTENIILLGSLYIEVPIENSSNNQYSPGKHYETESHLYILDHSLSLKKDINLNDKNVYKDDSFDEFILTADGLRLINTSTGTVTDIDYEGNPSGSYNVNDIIAFPRIIDILPNEENDLIVLYTGIYNQPDSEEDSDKLKVVKITADGNIIENEDINKLFEVLNVQYYSTSNIAAGTNGYDFYCSANCMYGINLDTGICTEIFNYDASCLKFKWFHEPVAFNNCFYAVRQTTEYDLPILLIPSADNNLTKTVFTLGGINIEQDDINVFNRISKEYYVKAVNYADEYKDGKLKISAAEKLVNDIRKGAGPDIIIVDSDNTYFSIDSLAEEGYFENLMPYICNDTRINTDDFFMNIIDAAKTDDKLFFLFETFELNTLLVNAAYCNGLSGGLSMRDFINIANSADDDTFLFQWYDRTELLRFFGDSICNSFIDFQNKTCNFESDDFKDFIKVFSKSNLTTSSYEYDTPVFTQSGLYSFEELIDNILIRDMVNEEYLQQELGYPVPDKCGIFIKPIYYTPRFAISSASSYKEAAWDCIYHELFSEYAFHDGLSIFKSTTSASLDNAISEFSAEEYTDKIYDEVFSLITNAKHLSRSYNDILSIIEEETEPFFLGQKTVDEVARIIQSRVWIYINE